MYKTPAMSSSLLPSFGSGSSQNSSKVYVLINGDVLTIGITSPRQFGEC